ncbi:ribonuclease HII [Cohnella lubricantis]|uniref:Ribonuclease HII n=2 Tax=Cohnella lubricantis TaxID=2163172 RepID=A0A841TAE7_9BACL|nr:ribonuclease HII [Cohnella lubricantis]MBB6677009.1 ribonuclease HII [Cohnella lubricantis]
MEEAERNKADEAAQESKRSRSKKNGRAANAAEEASEEAAAVDRLIFEKELWAQGLTAVAGIDEVGRGCLFGDVVAAAVVFPPGLVLGEINDSKQLSEKKRERLYDVILEHAVAWSVARVDAATVDRINIRQASRLAMKTAVETLSVRPEHLLIDAETVSLELPQTPIIKGDARSQSIGAASIIAKVTRDRLCRDVWEAMYPGYDIAANKGYGTKAHREGLLRMGPTPLHRMSFLDGILAEQQQLF